MRSEDIEEQGLLVLAAEDCDPELFEVLHKFSSYEERIIRSLTAHGPVLIRGGRGSGKSALIMEAHNRLSHIDSSVLSIYLSLRHLSLLRSAGQEYEETFCRLLIIKVNEVIAGRDINIEFSPEPEVSDVQQELVRLSSKIGSRIVLFFDDAAHLGRETSLSEFFDIFRTLSSSSVSCKAAIYPGVTKFGTRFDVYNDATVIDIARDERSSNFSIFFLDVMEARYPTLIEKIQLSRNFEPVELAGFLGRSVVGNMRSFIFACNHLTNTSSIGFPEITKCMLFLSVDYYWPLLEELTPKLGVYASLIQPSRELAEAVFGHAGKKGTTSVVIHKDWIQRMPKPFEILEYTGFISKREASKAMKSGGRGPRFKLNLCTLLENISGSRVTQDIFRIWLEDSDDPVEIHRDSSIIKIETPELPEDADLKILDEDISKLVKSNAYPYGLTEYKIQLLKEAGINTVRELAEASDEVLTNIQSVGEAFLRRIRNVVGQAIWM